MKAGCLILLALGMALPTVALAQATAYLEFTAADLSRFGTTNILVGPTVGIAPRLVTFKKVDLGFDFRGSFLEGNETLTQASIGPKASIHRGKYTGYGEFLVGFGRFNDGYTVSTSSTDGQFQFVGGVDRSMTKNLDARLEYTYEEYFGQFREFEPKLFSAGVVYHLRGR